MNNAGVYGPKGETEKVDWASWVDAIQINLMGSVLMCRALIPHFKSQKYGKIIQLSGGGATQPIPRISAYAVSKAAVVRLTETAAAEMSKKNIRINVIAPGANKTRMLDQFINSGGKPQTVVTINKPVELVQFLSSAISHHISGKFIHVLDDYRSFTKDVNHTSLYTLRRIEK